MKISNTFLCYLSVAKLEAILIGLSGTQRILNETNGEVGNRCKIKGRQATSKARAQIQPKKSQKCNFICRSCHLLYENNRAQF